MRWTMLAITLALGAACGDRKQPATEAPPPTPPVDAAPRVGTPAERDALFRSVPTAKAVRLTIERLSEKPHVAGSHGNAAVADDIAQTLQRLGWKTGEARYDVYLPHPKKLAITIASSPPLRDPPVAIATTEPAAVALGDAPMLWTWNGYSASGTVKAPLVLAGYGRAEDIAKIDVRGKVALVKYGPLYRGAQVASVERAGAAAVIFYNDPEDDPKRPADSVQRGTVAYYWQYTGDPLTPGVASKGDAKRLDPAKTDVLPKIPVVNVTATEAAKLRAAAGKPVEVSVVMDNATRPIRDILGFFPGKTDEAIILGNHYDAWGPGALDPHSGTAALIEIARGLTALGRAGWRPERTIVIGFWDAEELGVIGSTEWVEDQAAMLGTKAVAYFNIDTVKAGTLAVQGSPALRPFVEQCGKIASFKDLGIGSDWTAFLHHAGIPSLQWLTTGGPGEYHVWHSVLDDAARAGTESDPDFAAIPEIAKTMGGCAIQLADAPRLPLAYTAMAAWLRERATALKADATLVAAIDALDAAAKTVEASTADCDAALIAAERGFLAEDGIAGRPWYRHLAIGPDPANGYGALPLPELAAAKTPAERTRATERLVAAIGRVTTALRSCR